MNDISGKTLLYFLKQASESLKTFRAVLDGLKEETRNELGPLYIAADMQTNSMLGAVQRMQALLMSRTRSM